MENLTDPNEASLNPNLTIKQIEEAQINLLASVAAGKKTVEQWNEEGRSLIRLAAGRDQMIEGLGNRAWFNTKLDEEIARAIRSSNPLSILMFDVDGLKLINDKVGHHEGDSVLKAIGKVAILGGVRNTDTAVRLGGDEFAVLFPDTDIVQALIPTIRILHSIRGIGPTASMSLVQFDPSHDSAEEIYERADWGLYQIKQGNKNGIGLVLPNSSHPLTKEDLRLQLLKSPIDPLIKEQMIQDIITSTTLIHK